MPHRKPLSITSPDNRIALSTYCMLGISGILFVLGVSSSSALHIAAGAGFTDVWAVIMAMANFTAFTAALSAKRAYRPEKYLKTEGLAALSSGLSLVAFIIPVVAHFGFSALGTLTFAATFCVGQTLRAVQIRDELKVIKIARKHPVKSDPVLADPREEDSP